MQNLLSAKAQRFKISLEAQGDAEAFSTFTAEMAREKMSAFMELHSKDQPKLPDNVIIKNKTLNMRGHEVKLRIYRPDTLFSEDHCPCILYHTGGGLTIDMQIAQDGPCALMSQASDSVVISIQPPLAPECKHAEIVAVVDAVTEYIAKHPSEFKIDPNKIAITGYSMGGNLALLSALHAIEKNIPLVGVGIISGQVDCSLTFRDHPKYNQGVELDFLAPRDSQEMFINFSLPEAVDGTDPQYSPIYANLSTLPPMVLIGGDCDALMPDMRALKEKCDAAGVNSELISLKGMIHNAYAMWHKLGNDGPHMASIMGEKIKDLFEK